MVIDQTTPMLQWVVDNKPKWFISSLKSTAYMAQKQIKSGIRSGAPGGRPYVPAMQAARRRALDNASYSRKPLRSYPILGKLRNAVGYDKTRASQAIVTVGWLSRSAVRIGTWQETGVTQTVSAKMRRLFFAAGIGLRKGTTEIALPSRPTYAAMFPSLRSAIPEFMSEKIASYINGNDARSAASSNRIYRVYR
jgi:hypothetical protein